MTTTMNGKIRTEKLSFSYGERLLLGDISVEFADQAITAITGPSGTGKSTLLTVFNRLWEEIGGGALRGRVLLRLEGRWQDIHAAEMPVSMLRRRVGMVFQTPNPLPMSISANLAFPLKLAGIEDKQEIAARSREALLRVHLLTEVEDRLGSDARLLSGGQQQRLCLARALMLHPEVLLLDEPTSSLDPKACTGIEELLLELKESCAIVLVSHYQDQISRIADQVYLLGERTLLRQR